eukprot:470735_1
MGCCGNQEEEPVVGEDLELGLDGSAVDEIETYEQSVEKVLGVSSGVQIALGVMAVIQVIILFVLACVVWFVYKHYHHSTNPFLHMPQQYTKNTGAWAQMDDMDSVPNGHNEDVHYSEMDQDNVDGFEHHGSSQIHPYGQMGSHDQMMMNHIDENHDGDNINP